MTNRFIKFNDEILDAKKVMMLQDLARLLLENNQTHVKIQKFPYYDPIENELIASVFWTHRPSHIEITGLKTDVLLATYGYRLMDEFIVNEVLDNQEFKHPSFFKQVFKLLEDMRVLNAIVKIRPSMKDAIALRKQIRLNYTESQISVYRTKTTYTDLIFLYLEKSLITEDFYEVPSIRPDLDPILQSMYMYLPNFFMNYTSEDNKFLAERIMYQLDDLLDEDMLNEYYYIPRKVYKEIQAETFDDLKRVDAANVDGKDDTDEDDDIETAEADTKAQDSKSQGGSYLEMELHEGENSEAVSDNDNAREGDASDDMTDMMTKKGKGSNETIDNESGGQTGASSQPFALKGINENVEIKWNVPEITAEDRAAYHEVEREVQYEIKDLTQIIEKTIEREQVDERHNLTKGRLQRDLINWFIDDQYKMFYKKQDLSRSFDATFTLLVDASASMIDKMEETIKGVVLFHETLKKLNVKHEVLAFNEDAFDADDKSQPNIIDEIINIIILSVQKTALE